MGISNQTIRAIIREYHGFEVSDEQLELMRPELDIYEDLIEDLMKLDLSKVLSGRLLRTDEGGTSHAGQ